MINSYYQANTRSLSRDITNTCWWIIVIYLAGTLLNVFFTTHDRIAFLWNVTIEPGIQMTLLWGAVELYSRRASRGIEYVIVAAVNLLICIIVASLYTMPIAIYLLIFPILISLFYYRQPIINFAFVQALVSLASLYLLAGNLRETLAVSDLIMVAGMIVSTAMIIRNLRKRASAIMKELIRTSEEKQDLETKNTIMLRLNRIDAATELYNHKAFHEQLDAVIGQHGSTIGSVYLAILDIDNFKQVNDTFGHDAGDSVIRYVADQIRSKADTSDFAARYGGEEFAIIGEGTEIERFRGMLESIRSAIEASPRPELGGRTVTVSIGWHRLQEDMSKEELFRKADSALYRAKKSGKNRIEEAE